MSFQIYNVIIHFLLKFGSFKMLWIFVFVVSSITTFLMVMYNTKKEELKKSILSEGGPPNIVSPDAAESVDDALQNLSIKLTEKEHILKESRCRLQDAEKTLNDIESKNVSIRDRYKTLMVELKNDLAKTEYEYNGLLDQVAGISQRREDLKNDVLEQQRMLVNFNRQLENREGSNRAKLRSSGRMFEPGILPTATATRIQNSPSDIRQRF